MRRLRLPAAAFMAAALSGCIAAATPTPPPACPASAPTADQAASIVADASRAVVVTNKGELTIDLDTASAPIAVANFVALSRCGFYDGISFHRIVPGFVAQAGDPQTRTNRGDFEGLGSGGPGYRFDIEIPDPSVRYARYTVAMANAMQYDAGTGQILGGADTNGSQFFVMLDDVPSLPPFYSVMGAVSAGTEVVDAIGQVPTAFGGLPLDPVIIETIRIEGDAEAS